VTSADAGTLAAFARLAFKDDQTLQLPNLIGGKTDARGHVHRVNHAIYQRLKRIIDIGDRFRLGPQDRIREGSDLQFVVGFRHPHFYSVIAAPSSISIETISPAGTPSNAGATSP
jgi:hypothetical protein